jgi:integrase
MSLELYPRDGVFWVRGRPADVGDYIRRSLRTSDPAIAAAKVRKLEDTARQRHILGAAAPKPEDEITFAACVTLYPAPKRDAGYLKPIVKKIGNERVRDLMPAAIKALAKRMMPDAATDTWERQIITPISAVINNAHELGKCAPIRVRSFTKAERVKQDEARGKQSRIPKTPGSWEWLEAFKAHAPSRDAALAHFMFRHGYRLTQSIEMTRSKDMDLSAGKVRVHASKGHPAHWVDLDADEVAMIANLPVPFRGQARDRVFTIAGGRSGALYRRWKAACEAAKIAYLPPHSCGRHGYGTEMVVRQHDKVDLISAAEDKWADPSVMLKTYSHAEDGKKRVAEAFAAGRAAAARKTA